MSIIHVEKKMSIKLCFIDLFENMGEKKMKTYVLSNKIKYEIV